MAIYRQSWRQAADVQCRTQPCFFRARGKFTTHDCCLSISSNFATNVSRHEGLAANIKSRNEFNRYFHVVLVRSRTHVEVFADMIGPNQSYPANFARSRTCERMP